MFRSFPASSSSPRVAAAAVLVLADHVVGTAPAHDDDMVVVAEHGEDNTPTTMRQQLPHRDEDERTPSDDDHHHHHHRSMDFPLYAVVVDVVVDVDVVEDGVVALDTQDGEDIHSVPSYALVVVVVALPKEVVVDSTMKPA